MSPGTVQYASKDIARESVFSNVIHQCLGTYSRQETELRTLNYRLLCKKLTGLHVRKYKLIIGGRKIRR